MTDMPTEKTCTGCGETKPLEDFKKHKAGRFGRESKCKDCERERQRAWRERNPDYVREYMKDWRERNPDYFASHKADHPEIQWAARYRERAGKFGFEPVVEKFTKADVIERYGDQCWHCKGAPFEELDHHPAPVAAEGRHTLENVRPSCSSCNVAGTWPARRAREKLRAPA